MDIDKYPDTESLPDPDVSETGAIDKETQHRYRIFKKNSPFLYDHVSTNSLLWPSLSVQFFPDLESEDKRDGAEKSQPSPDLVSQRLLFGTFTLGQSVDAIHIQQLPYYRNLNKCINVDAWTYNSDKEEFELPALAQTRLRSLQAINHHGDVNKLKYMPQNPDIIASANNLGDLHIYNRTKHSTIKKLGEESKVNDPQLRLVNPSRSQPSDIFALDWNKQAEGVVVSGAMTGVVNVFDIRKNYSSRNGDTIEQFWHRDHGIGINDVEWLARHDSLFASADDSGAFFMSDLRCGQPTLTKKVGSDPLNGISVNPTNHFCVATGDSQGCVSIWDIRAPENPLKSISEHVDSITQVKWHPKFSNVLASSSADRSVKLFNLTNAADPLLFSHEGHMLGVNDFDWSPHEDWMLASVADDNSLHVWKPASRLVQ